MRRGSELDDGKRLRIIRYGYATLSHCLHHGLINIKIGLFFLPIDRKRNLHTPIFNMDCTTKVRHSYAIESCSIQP